MYEHIFPGLAVSACASQHFGSLSGWRHNLEERLDRYDFSPVPDAENAAYATVPTLPSSTAAFFSTFWSSFFCFFLLYLFFVASLLLFFYFCHFFPICAILARNNESEPDQLIFVPSWRVDERSSSLLSLWPVECCLELHHPFVLLSYPRVSIPFFFHSHNKFYLILFHLLPMSFCGFITVCFYLLLYFFCFCFWTRSLCPVFPFVPGGKCAWGLIKRYWVAAESPTLAWAVLNQCLKGRAGCHEKAFTAVLIHTAL